MRQPATLLEIDFVERPAPAAPMVRAAAEKPQPRRVERGERRLDDGAAVKRLGLGVEIHPAAFEQDDVQRRIGQRQSQRNPGGAAADDGQIRLQERALGNAAGINERAQSPDLSNDFPRRPMLPAPAPLCLVEIVVDAQGKITTTLRKTDHFPSVRAIAALAVRMYCDVVATVLSFSNHRNGQLSFCSGKSGLMTITPGTKAPGTEE